MYIDTHCHLNFPEFDRDRAMVIGNARKANVKRFINPGVDLLSSRQAVELAKKYPGVIYPAVGFHPYESQHQPDLNRIESLIDDTVIAVGECGLDYHQYKGEQATGKKDNQKRIFQEQLLMAMKYHKPVIMHCRDAFDDFFDILDSIPTTPRGVIHCFSGGLQEVRMAQERKLFIGVDGNVTYSKSLARIVPEIPLSMIDLETDAPYLTPVPHRGTRNEPKYIPLIAKTIAGLRQISPSAVEEQTGINASLLFQFP